MKRQWLFISIIIICLLSGCKQENNITKNSDSSLTNDSIIYASKTYSDGAPILDFETRYENLKNKYPDKTILVWASEQNIRYENEVNNYLTDNNSEYVICFKNIMEELEDNNIINDKNGNWLTSYSEVFREEIKNSQQVDIVSTEKMYLGYDGFINTYQYFATQGWLEPIEDYLTNTETGKKFYNIASEKYWKSLECNGHIYGFDGSLSCLGNTAGYEFNTDLFNKLNVNTNDLKGSYEETFNKILGICKNNDLLFSVNNLMFMSMYTDYDYITSCVYINDDGKAENIFESYEAKTLFNLIYEGFNNGYITNRINSVPKERLMGITIDRTCGAYLVDKINLSSYFSSLGTESDGIRSFQLFPKCSDTIHSTVTATGISSSSEHKDLAFDALAKIMTDEKLNNLICYGTDYEIVDGCVSPNGHYDTMDVGNKLVNMPFMGFEYSDKKERLNTAFQNSKISENIKFIFSSSKISSQVAETEKIIYEIIEDFPSTKFKSGEEYLQILNKKLYDAGLQEVLDEANRQLEEYHNKNNF